jgi:hypothetical protein
MSRPDASGRTSDRRAGTIMPLLECRMCHFMNDLHRDSLGRDASFPSHIPTSATSYSATRNFSYAKVSPAYASAPHACACSTTCYLVSGAAFLYSLVDFTGANVIVPFPQLRSPSRNRGVNIRSRRCHECGRDRATAVAAQPGSPNAGPQCRTPIMPHPNHMPNR